MSYMTSVIKLIYESYDTFSAIPVKDHRSIVLDMCFYCIKLSSPGSQKLHSVDFNTV